MDAAYESARVRVQIGQACRALGDVDSAEMEFRVACQAFQQLDATPDVDRLRDLINFVGWTTRKDSLPERCRCSASSPQGRQTSTLVISEHTVARHLQNIFRKLGMPSRTAATAFALEHNLI
jgi:hypothetical protein